MNWQTWEALARRHTAYRDLLRERMDRLDPGTDYDALGDRVKRHDARMRRHMDKALTASDL